MEELSLFLSLCHFASQIDFKKKYRLTCDSSCLFEYLQFYKSPNLNVFLYSVTNTAAFKFIQTFLLVLAIHWATVLPLDMGENNLCISFEIFI